MHTFKNAVTTFACFFAFANLVSADDVTDFYFQQAMQRYYEAPESARTFGMAGSSVATTSDSSSTYGNPAGLGLMAGGELSAGYGYDRVSGDEYPTGRGVEQVGQLGTGALALPIVPTLDGLPEFGNIGLAWDGYESNWEDDSYNSVSERTQVHAAYAYGVTQNFSVGYSLGWTRDKFQSKDIVDYPMGDGFRHTLGALYKISSAVTLGTSIFYGYGEHHTLYGPGVEANSDTEQFGWNSGMRYQITAATALALGLGYRHFSSDGDVEESLPQNFVGGDENGNTFDVRLGAEHDINEWFSIRGGYRYAGLSSYNYSRVELNRLNGSADYSAFSLGAGLKFALDSQYVRSINLDYGVEYRIVGDGDWSHLITLSLPFNLCQAA